MKKKGFTLIELLAVIVIMAILALIAIPITIKIISDSRENANKQSILNYAKAVEQDVVNWKTENNNLPITDYKGVYKKREIKVTGDKVSCKEIDIDKDMNLSLYKCYLLKYGEEKSKKYDYIDGKVVESDSEESLVLNYAKNIETDIPKWKQDTSNDNYTQYDFNRIQDDKITCDEKSVSSEGKLTLDKCYLKDSKEDNRTYYSYKNGKVEKEKSSSLSQDDSTNKIAYTIGQKITVAGEQYYVIANSPSGQDYVTALKANPLTVDEINANKIGSDNVNHVNRYTSQSVGEAYNSGDDNHTGGMAYYTSSTCGYNPPNQSDTGVWLTCTTSYDLSDIKHIVDNWSTKFTNNELKEVTLQGYGIYKARLATKEEIQPIGWPSCTESQMSDYGYCQPETDTPSWTWNANYWYWTMSEWNNYGSIVWLVNNAGNLDYDYVYNYFYKAVRPVINVKKSKIQKQ